jgi:molecular chaperone HtpG
MSAELIKFEIETKKVVQLLAKQIYQSPLALLRENTQNAFDAIKLRLHKGDDFEPRISIHLTPDTIAISDNGIGMTRDDLRKHYWRAGSSSKNNDEARAAGVVGTFGIGAMANFGIANEMEVDTQSAVTGVRTISRASLEKLSVIEDCIELHKAKPKEGPGTTVTAQVLPSSRINVDQATAYIRDFVALVDVPVFVNGDLISRVPIESLVPVVPSAWKATRNGTQFGARLEGDLKLVLSNNADVWLSLSNIIWSGKQLTGRMVLRSGMSNLRTYRSGFGLATASVSSAYQFGGVADMLILEPTAGREAVTVEGMQLLQSMMTEIDSHISDILSKRPECDASTSFMNWVVAHKRYELCSLLTMSLAPGQGRITLGEVRDRTKTTPMLLYAGQDQSVLSRYASEDSPVLVMARGQPRLRCEQQYLSSFCKTNPISDQPEVTRRKRRSDWSSAENALAFRLENILDADYFLKSSVDFGSITHSLPLLVDRQSSGVRITLDPAGETVRLILGLYQNEYTAFGSMAKDFVRSMIFPRVSEFVPSATRVGAEAFLRSIRKPRELMEYDETDTDSLSVIWEDYREGKISMETAVEKSMNAVRSTVQYVEPGSTANVRDVVRDVIENESALRASGQGDASPNFEASPAITRMESQSSAKLLTIGDDEPDLHGHRCFIALSDRTREEMGDFFLQPHRTSVVWGGQKTLFIFLHHSGEIGLYYDLQTREPIQAPSGGGRFQTATIILKDRIYIPVPSAIQGNFIPASRSTKALRGTSRHNQDGG